jgi:hypothetical protein
MNLTKFLCKTFDKEDKGYVTIEDILDNILCFLADAFVILLIAAVGGFVAFFICALFGALYENVVNGTPANDLIYTLHNIITGFILLAVTFGLSYLVYNLGKNKIS